MKCHQTMTYLFALLLCPLMTEGRKASFPAVSGFELERYLGTWYEIARLPNSFEKDLIKVTAEYTLRQDGRVRVVNRGIRPRDNKEKKAVGRAKFAAARNLGHLRVSFFGPFYSDYIIIELGQDYEYALVAGGSHKYLWILARTAKIDTELRDKLVSRAAELGFAVDRLFFVPHD